MKLHRDLGVSQKTAWMMAQKIREGKIREPANCQEALNKGETYVGGKSRNKHLNKRNYDGRGIVGKSPVIGAKQRGGPIKAQPLPSTDKQTIQGFIHSSA